MLTRPPIASSRPFLPCATASSSSSGAAMASSSRALLSSRPHPAIAVAISPDLVRLMTSHKSDFWLVRSQNQKRREKPIERQRVDKTIDQLLKATSAATPAQRPHQRKPDSKRVTKDSVTSSWASRRSQRAGIGSQPKQGRVVARAPWPSKGLHTTASGSARPSSRQTSSRASVESDVALSDPSRPDAGDVIEYRSSEGETSFGVVLPGYEAQPSLGAESASTVGFVLELNGQITMIKEQDIVLHLRNPLGATRDLLGRCILSHREMIDIMQKKVEREAAYTFEPLKGLQLAPESSQEAGGSTLRRRQDVEFKTMQSRARLCGLLRDFTILLERHLKDLREAFIDLTNDEDFLERHDFVRTEAITRELLLRARAKQGLRSQPIPDPKDPALFAATHMMIMDSAKYFLADPKAHHTTATFSVHPRAYRERLETVEEWMEEDRRGQQTPVDDFVSKARKVLQAKGKGTSSGERWSKNDIVILSLLLDGIGTTRTIQRLPVFSACAFIMDKVGRLEAQPVAAWKDPKDDPFDLWRIDSLTRFGQTMSKFFEDLDVLPKPFVNWALADQASRNVLTEMIRRLNRSGSPPEETVADDVDLDSPLRKDFDGTVFVIDDASAHELDDGVSIEDGPSKAQAWIRVHIADPTSMFAYDHPIAVKARQQGATLYLGACAVPMLPSSISGIAPGSAVHNKELTGRSRALTFSALLDLETGGVIDFDVGLKTLSRVVKVTYSKASQILARESGNAGQGSSHDEVSSFNQAQLRRLAEALKILQRRREEKGWMAFRSPSQPLFTDKQGNRVLPPLVLPVATTLEDPKSCRPFNQGLDFRESPLMNEGELTLSIVHHEAASPLRGSAGMVQEAMIIACQVAAAWIQRTSKELGTQVAVPYRSLLPKNIDESDIESAFEQLVPESDHESEATPFPSQRLAAAGIQDEAATIALQPSTHIRLGVTGGGATFSNPKDVLEGAGYTRVTSPLRRYSDMLCHWQIKGLLHLQASSARTDDEEAVASPSRRLIPTTTVSELMRELKRKNSSISDLQDRSRQYWVAKALANLLEDPDWRAPVLSSSLAEELAQAGARLLTPADIRRPLRAFLSDSELRVDPATGQTLVRVYLSDFALPAAACRWQLFWIKPEDYLAELSKQSQVLRNRENILLDGSHRDRDQDGAKWPIKSTTFQTAWDMNKRLVSAQKAAGKPAMVYNTPAAGQEVYVKLKNVTASVTGARIRVDRCDYEPTWLADAAKRAELFSQGMETVTYA